MWKNIVCALLSLFLIVGCSKGPNKDNLQKEVQAKLDAKFPELFQIKDFQRRGSYPYTADGDTAPKLLLYFKAKVEFQKDYKLSGWDGYNVGSLTSVLGASQQGIQGVNIDGNKKGEALLVYGTSNYTWKDNAWQAISKTIEKDESAKEREAAAPVKRKLVFEMEEEEKQDLEDLSSVRRQLVELYDFQKEFNKKKDADSLKFLENELRKVLREAEFRKARNLEWTTIATGGSSGDYYALGKGLEKIITTRKKVAKAYITEGSAANCKLVADGQVLFGFTQNDIAHFAFNGQGDFSGRALSDLRALCSLYPEVVHIVTLGKSEIKSVRELVGKKIDIGPAGSGVQVNALQILDAYGLKKEAFSSVAENDVHTAMDKLKAGELDAVFVTGAYPNKLLFNASQEFGIKILSLEDDILSRLAEKQPFIRMEIPAKTYHNQSEKISTVGVTATLVTSESTPDKVVKEFLDSLFKNIAPLSKNSVQANYISKEKVTTGVTIPFHAAAKAYFELP